MIESAGDTRIYLDNQGNYRDKTPENLEQYPPAAESPAEDADVAPEETPVPPVEDNELPNGEDDEDEFPTAK